MEESGGAERGIARWNIPSLNKVTTAVWTYGEYCVKLRSLTRDWTWFEWVVGPVKDVMIEIEEHSRMVNLVNEKISLYLEASGDSDAFIEWLEKGDRLEDNQIDFEEDNFLLGMPFLFAVVKGEDIAFKIESFQVLLDKLPISMFLERYKGYSLLDFVVKLEKNEFFDILIEYAGITHSLIAEAAILAIDLDREQMAGALLNKLPRYTFGGHISAFRVALSSGEKGMKHVIGWFKENLLSPGKDYYDCPAVALKVDGVIDVLLRPENAKVAEDIFCDHLLASEYFDVSCISLRHLALIHKVNSGFAVKVVNLFPMYKRIISRLIVGEIKKIPQNSDGIEGSTDGMHSSGPLDAGGSPQRPLSSDAINDMPVPASPVRRLRGSLQLSETNGVNGVNGV